MRRIILEEPLSRAAVWSSGAAVFSITVALFGIVLARKGLDPTAAVAIEGGAVVLACCAIVFALVAMAVIWRTGYRGTSRVLSGLFGAALTLAYPAYLAHKARTVEGAGDVSTDLADPPAFSHSAQALAGRNGQVIENPPAAALDAQRRLYPDLQSLVLDEEPGEAYKQILKILTARRWTVLEAVPPTAAPPPPVPPDRSRRPGRPALRAVSVAAQAPRPGHIDAVAYSFLMGFPADVAIRIKAVNNQTQVDIRSVSRTKWHDPGADAQRVEALSSDIEDEADK